MTTKELLTIRYKVIADYLFSPYKIGDIIQSNEYHKSVKLATISVREYGEPINQECFYDIDDCKLYPALFKEISWWEDRKVEDMPEYVKCKTGVYKVWHFDINYGKVIFEQGKICPLRQYKPTTEQEYNEYQSLKQ